MPEELLPRSACTACTAWRLRVRCMFDGGRLAVVAFVMRRL
jgi:hypothetical protein